MASAIGIAEGTSAVRADYMILHDMQGGVSDGWFIEDSVTLSGSTLYGAAAGDGPTGKGFIFQLQTDGTGYGIVHAFDGGALGDGPAGTPTLAGSAFYGTTFKGGTNDHGVLYTVNVDGSDYQVLHTFGSQTGDAVDPTFKTRRRLRLNSFRHDRTRWIIKPRRGLSRQHRRHRLLPPPFLQRKRRRQAALRQPHRRGNLPLRHHLRRRREQPRHHFQNEP